MNRRKREQNVLMTRRDWFPDEVWRQMRGRRREQLTYAWMLSEVCEFACNLPKYVAIMARGMNNLSRVVVKAAKEMEQQLDSLTPKEGK